MLYVGYEGSRFILPSVLYTSDWGTDADLQPSAPVPWPTAPDQSDEWLFAHVENASAGFLTLVPPDRVLVQSFAKVSAATGEPTGRALTTYECSRFESPKCGIENTMAGLVRVTSVPRQVLHGNFITVFAVWHASAEQVHAGASAERTATWLYRGQPETLP